MQLQRIHGRGVGKVVLLTCFAAWLAFTAGASAFTFSSLRLGATNGPENYVFTAGDKLVPLAQIDADKVYRVTVFNPSGAVISASGCRSNFTAFDNSYTVQASDLPSTNGAYTFRVEQFSTCASTQATVLTRSFYVVSASAFYIGAPTNRFAPGQTASVRIYGLPTNQANWSTSWIMPSGATSCVNNASADRPDSSANGTMPATNGTFLMYPPWSVAPDAWNNSGNYELGNCTGFTTTNEGAWKLSLSKSNTNFVALPVFTVASFCTTIPLTNLTRGVMANAVFNTIAAGTGPFTYAWFRNEAIIAGQTNGTLVLTNLALSDAGTYSVEVSGPCTTVRRSATLNVVSCSPSLDVMLVIDRSGSMLGTPYTDARTACTNLIRDLHFGTGDQAGLVSYNTGVTIDLTLTNDPSVVEQSVSALPPASGGTAISSGLQAARDELISTRHNPYSLPVIVLLSDGLPHSSGDSSSNVLYNATLAKNLGVLVFSIAVGDADASLMSGVASASNTFFLATNSAQFSQLFHTIANLLCRTPTNLVFEGPTNQTVCVGSSAAFVMTASGCDGLSFQWRKDGVALANATNNVLLIPSANANDAGIYSVVVDSECRILTNFASLIVEQPPLGGTIPSQTVCDGSTAVFQTTPGGTGPFTFVWRKNGGLLASETSGTLTIPSASSQAAGDYSVEIYNACGALTNAARLSVNAAVSATSMADQTHCVGEVAIFLTTMNGAAPASITWRKDGAKIDGATDPWLVVPILSATDAGRYSIEVSSGCNTVTNFVMLFVPESTTATPLASITNFISEVATFSTTPSGTGPFNFVWRKDGVLIGGAISNVLSVAVSSPADAGDYGVEVSGQCNTVIHYAALTVKGLTTATPLMSSTNCIGDPVLFSTTPGGTGPFTFVWRKDGVKIDGATNSSLVVTVTSPVDGGDYSVKVSGTASSVTNHATLSVNPPTAASPLASVTNCVGSSATFSTTPAGAGPFTFVWRRNGVLISDATNATFTLTAITPGDDGQYTVEVSGQCNRTANPVTSTASLVVVNQPAATGLANLMACPGETVTLAATATGSAPLNYLWRRNGAVIPGRSNVLVLTNVTSAHAGTYSFEVNNSCGGSTNTMTLFVRTNLSATPLTNFSRCQGGAVTFATTITGPGPYTIQWLKDGIALGGQTNSTLSLSNLTTNDSGTYRIEIFGGCNAITNSATLSVSSTTTATPLAPVVACAGFPAAFATTPDGVGPFTFVWRRNGVVLQGQTNNTLAITSVNATNVGTYSVTVNGSCGSVTNSAALTVSSALASSMPTNIVLCGCDDGLLAPSITGASPLSIRWYHNGTLIQNATNNFLSIPKANLATPGDYRIEISDPCNTVTNTTLVSLGKAGDGFFTSTQRISIPDFGAVDPYPSIIEVICAPTDVSDLRVTLYDLSHAYPDDIDLMLVSPQGQALMLMSDAGGTSVNHLDGVTLTFDDRSQFVLQDSKRITNGVYKPTNYGLPDDDVFEAPAPGGPTITNLAGFNGTNPNGQWHLFVVDDHGLDAGAIAGGWSLDFGPNFSTDPQLRLNATGVTNGVFNALLFGTIGTTCFVEGSVNMRDWTVLSTNQITVSPLPISSNDPTYRDYQFFRASSCRNN